MTGFVLPAATLWWRECVRFYRDRVRALSSIVTAVLFWVLIGFGLGGSFAPQGCLRHGIDRIPLSWNDRLRRPVDGDRGTFSLIEDRREDSCGRARGARARVDRHGKGPGRRDDRGRQGALLMVVAPLVGIPYHGTGSRSPCSRCS